MKPWAYGLGSTFLDVHLHDGFKRGCSMDANPIGYTLGYRVDAGVAELADARDSKSRVLR